MLTTLRKCLRMLPPAVRGRWLLLVPVAATTSLAEMASAGAIFALLLMLTEPARAMSIPWLAGLVSYLPRQAPDAVILQLSLLLAVLYVVKGALLIGSQYLRHRVAQRSNSQLASEMFGRYLSAPYPFHFRRNSAALIRNCTSTVAVALGGVIGSVVSIATDLLMSAGLIVMLLAASPIASLVAGISLFLIMVVVLRLTSSAATRLGQESHELGLTVLKSLQQALGGIKEVKVLGREHYFYEDFLEGQRRLLRLGYLGITLGSVPAIAVQTLLMCGALALIATLTLMGQSGIELLPVAGVFGYAGMRILPMTNSILATVNGIRGSRQAVDELYDDFMVLEELPIAVPSPIKFTSEIKLEQVSYAYPASDRLALQDITLTIRRGEAIGVIGPTGAGKSTLVDLVLGLLSPSQGEITVDGASLGSGGAPWRRRVGYVPQAVFLLDESLRRNIALGIHDREIDDRRIHTVLGMVQLEHFVAELPQGLDTVIGERGIRLSGGERQRVAMARALYHDPDLIVFDEATSALDVATEAEVTAAIEGLHGLKTMIIIAHRLSTVRQCDRLVWLRAGRVAGIGSFDDLLRADQQFRDLAALAAL